MQFRKHGVGGTTGRSGASGLSASGSFERFVEHIPSAFAVTRGDRHTLVYVNAAFHALLSPGGTAVLGAPLANALSPRDTLGLTAVLDRVFRTGVVARDRRIEAAGEHDVTLSFTVWPEGNTNGQPEHLVIELRAATAGELTRGLQREVAERLLLSALREQDAADAAELSRKGAAYLAAESRRLADSLDEGATLTAIAGLALPHVGAWCVVDTLDEQDIMHRLAIVHPDPAKQALLDELEGRWAPRLDDGFGLAAALRSAGRTVIIGDFNPVGAGGDVDLGVIRVLRTLDAGPVLTVPLVIRDRLVGAVTFVGEGHGRPFSAEDMELAEDLAGRSAMALDRARLYGEALVLRARAELAGEAKAAFLGMMSHELRTPLNAIGGYVDLMDMEIHGPVTEAQHVDLGRIRSNQRYLMGLINDVLNFTKVGSGHLVYDVSNLVVHDVIAATVALVEPLIAQKGLLYEGNACDATIVARGDPERVSQILVNLLSNSIKFTPINGRISVDCTETDDTVMMLVSDTGIGISADKLDVIFEPFVQVKSGAMGSEAGIGLGLAISRSLARAMDGDLVVESTLGEGSRFTLTLPRAARAAPQTGEIA